MRTHFTRVYKDDGAHWIPRKRGLKGNFEILAFIERIPFSGGAKLFYQSAILSQVCERRSFLSLLPENRAQLINGRVVFCGPIKVFQAVASLSRKSVSQMWCIRGANADIKFYGRVIESTVTNTLPRLRRDQIASWHGRAPILWSPPQTLIYAQRQRENVYWIL